MDMLAEMDQLAGPFVEWAMGALGPDDDGASRDLPHGHPGVIVGRGPLHLDVLWVGHENEIVSVGAVYDASNVRQIDVYTFAERALALKGMPHPPRGESDTSHTVV